MTTSNYFLLARLILAFFLISILILLGSARPAIADEPITVEGEVKLLYVEDFAGGNAEEVLQIYTEGEELFELDIATNPNPEALVGEMVRVKGTTDGTDGDTIEVASTKSTVFRNLNERAISAQTVSVSRAARRAPEGTLDFLAEVDEDLVPTTGVGVALGDTFKIHSRPNSTYTIFLDFDGHTDTGIWASYYAAGSSITFPAFSLDTDKNTFSTAELTAIQNIWQRIAEYYAPYNINVTTEDPGPAALLKSGTTDNVFGIRTVITSDTRKAYGGLAYVGSFDWNTDTAALVFSSRLANNTKNISDAAGHEIGHAVGLNHDGAGTSEYYYGHVDWAPLLGVGYSKAIVQMSKGEYYKATNLQDDHKTITTSNSGVGFAADEAGNDVASATDLNVSGLGAVDQWGVISEPTDKDFYSFDVGASGNIAVTVKAVTRGYINGRTAPFFDDSPFSALDIEARLYGPTGDLITTVNPTGLDATVNLTGLSAGTYTLAIDGVGKGSPLATPPSGYTDYGSLGQYKIQGTITTGGGTTSLPTVTLTASPTSITTGQSATLSWSSTNATACTASGGWSGSKAVSGTQSVSPTATTTYTITCTGAGGTKAESVAVSVTPAAGVPSVSINASPTLITSGSSSTLTWSSANVTSCTASGGWSGSKAVSGTQSVSPTATTTYTITCTGAGGSKVASVVVGVAAVVTPLPTVVLTVAPTSIVKGGAATLSWSSTNATACTASGGWSGSKAVSGTQSVSPTATTTYTITCTGAGGTGAASVTVPVTVVAAKAPTVTINATPLSIKSGESSVVTWSSTDATSCTGSGGWSGSKTVSGTATINPTASASYTLACTGAGGTANGTVSVTVTTGGTVGGGDPTRPITPPPSHSRGFKINIGATEVNLLASIPPPPTPTVTSTPKAWVPQLVGSTGVDVFQALDFGGNPTYISKGGNDVFYMPGLTSVGMKELDSRADTTAVVSVTRGGYNLPPNIKTFLFAIPDARGGSYKGNDLDNVMITTATPVAQSGRLVFNGRLGDDIIVLGSATVDEVVIDADTGTDTIINFNTAVPGGDIVRLYPGAFTNYKELKAALRPVGGDTVLVLKNGEELWFKNVAPTAFAPSHFVKLSSDWVAFNWSGGRVLGASTDALRLTERLSLRSSGEEVRLVQDVLRFLGYYDDLSTGYFGPKTEAALQVFQSEHGLEALGIVGPLTRSLLNGVLE